MASRLYFPSSGTAATSPAYDASWTVTTGAVRRPLAYRPGTTAVGGLTLSETSATEVRALGDQYVSDPLPANFTLSGTVMFSIGGRSPGWDTGFAQLRVIVKVVTSANVVRGTVFTGERYLNYYPFFQTSIISGALTELACQAGDRIVIERGIRFANTTTTQASGTYFQGDNYAIPDDSQYQSQNTYAGNDYKPWVEFSQDQIWGPNISRVATAPTQLLEQPVRTPSRVAGAELVVMEQPVRTETRIGATAVQVMIPLAGQRIRVPYAVGAPDTQPYVKHPDGIWRAFNPV